MAGALRDVGRVDGSALRTLPPALHRHNRLDDERTEGHAARTLTRSRRVIAVALAIVRHTVSLSGSAAKPDRGWGNKRLTARRVAESIGYDSSSKTSPDTHSCHLRPSPTRCGWTCSFLSRFTGFQ